MAWNVQTATQTGQKLGLLKPNEVAQGGLLAQRAKDRGVDLNPYMKAANNMGQSGLPGVKPLSVASFSQPQKTAIERMTQPSAPVNPQIGETLSKATTAAGQIRNPYDPESYKQFMNPYIADVVDTTADRIRRGYDDARTQAREQIGAAGAFGSTALGQMYGDVAEDQERQVADTTAQLMASGFDQATANALGLYGTQGQQALAQTGAYGSLAGQMQGLDQYERGIDLGDINRMFAGGSAIQEQNQRVLDAYFAERERKLNEPVRQAEILRNALVSYPTGQSSTQVLPGNPYLGAISGGTLASRMFPQGFSGGGYNPASETFTPQGYLPYRSQGTMPWQTPGASYPVY